MRALILVDLQNDFFPEGALPVAEGNRVLPAINTLLEKKWDVVVATKDFHPRDHGSFANNHFGKKPGEVIELAGLYQILWPVHCVENTKGSEFVPGFDHTKVDEVFYKGTDKWVDSYSTFFDNGHKKSTQLEKFLKDKGIDEVYLAGLATEYCVKYSVLDALLLGFRTYVVTDGCRGVNLKEKDSQEALDEMKRRGAHLVTSQQIV